MIFELSELNTDLLKNSTEFVIILTRHILITEPYTGGNQNSKINYW